MIDKKILYITFTDLNATAKAGSELRPQKMLAALQETSSEVRYVSGIQNNYKARLGAYRTVMAWLKEWRPDLCYIEPPSGPLFFACDRQLIRKLHALHVPIGLFYRDAYWRFPELVGDSSKHRSLKDKLKSKLIFLMQQRDWKLYKNCCKRIYFPTKLMSSYFDCEQAGVLPPGCTNNYKKEKPGNSIPRAIYVGGATELYGVPLLLDAGALVNEKKTVLNICIVTSEQGWNSFLEKHPKYNAPFSWIELHHLDAGLELEALYRTCDFAIIPRVKNTYHDFAFPVKLSEYLSHLLPVVSTDCFETEKFIEAAKIGITAKDTATEFAEALLKMTEDNQLRDRCYKNSIVAREQNLWTRRAETVINDLVNED